MAMRMEKVAMYFMMCGLWCDDVFVVQGHSPAMEYTRPSDCGLFLGLGWFWRLCANRGLDASRESYSIFKSSSSSIFLT